MFRSGFLFWARLIASVIRTAPPISEPINCIASRLVEPRPVKTFNGTFAIARKNLGAKNVNASIVLWLGRTPRIAYDSVPIWVRNVWPRWTKSSSISCWEEPRFFFAHLLVAALENSVWATVIYHSKARLNPFIAGPITGICKGNADKPWLANRCSVGATMCPISIPKSICL